MTDRRGPQLNSNSQENLEAQNEESKGKFKGWLLKLLICIGLGVFLFFLPRLFDPTSGWQDRIDSGNPVKYEEVGDLGKTYYNELDEETGIRHVAWKRKHSPKDGSDYFSFLIARFKNGLMTNYASTSDSWIKVNEKFEEWNAMRPQTVYVSATPSNWEIERTGGVFAEQVIRPTGLLDPEVEIRPVEMQVDDLVDEIRKVAANGFRTLVTTLTKRMAEDLTEYLHEQVRTRYWGYAREEQMSNEELIKENYLGIRPAPGYPACPDHLEKQTLFDLLDVGRHTGGALTESMAMVPAASVSGYYFAHPDSRYFALGKIKEDQLKEYAERKNLNLEVARKWLSPNLID